MRFFSTFKIAKPVFVFFLTKNMTKFILLNIKGAK